MAVETPSYAPLAEIPKSLGALRLGWVLGAPELLDRIRRVDNLVSVEPSTPALLQANRIWPHLAASGRAWPRLAAPGRAWPRLAALRQKTMAPMRKNLKFLRTTGLRFLEPEAGLTAFVEVGDGDGVAAALEKQGIGVARGSFFDAPEHVRIFLRAKPAVFLRGVTALADYCRGR